MTNKEILEDLQEKIDNLIEGQCLALKLLMEIFNHLQIESKDN